MLKFNVLKFSNDLDFTATDNFQIDISHNNFQIDISHNNFKNYYNQSQKYSANKVYQKVFVIQYFWEFSEER